MIITDAIVKAGSEHAIYFLLTAYLEAVRAPIPESVRAFPILGRDDVEWRLVALLEAADASGTRNAAITEAALVFGTALRQLETLSVRQPPNVRRENTIAS